MIAHEVFAMIYDRTIQNVVVGHHEETNWVARCVSMVTMLLQWIVRNIPVR